jgi:hypothetical protein
LQGIGFCGGSRKKSGRAMNHLIMQVIGEQSYKVSGGVVPIVFPRPEFDDFAAPGNTRPHFDQFPHAGQSDRNCQISQAFTQFYRPFEPRHQLAAM